jgi:hypothetical protein
VLGDGRVNIEAIQGTSGEGQAIVHVVVDDDLDGAIQVAGGMAAMARLIESVGRGPDMAPVTPSPDRAGCPGSLAIHRRFRPLPHVV